MVALKDIPYNIEQANTLLRLPQLDAFMHKLKNYELNSRDWDVPLLVGHSRDFARIYVDRDLPSWQWIGVPVRVTHFLVLGEHIAMALLNAFQKLQGRELQALLIHARMANKDDDPYSHAYGVANCAIDFAVRQQYSKSGVKSYRRFVEAQRKPSNVNLVSKVPLDLDMTLYDDKLLAVIAKGATDA